MALNVASIIIISKNMELEYFNFRERKRQKNF